MTDTNDKPFILSPAEQGIIQDKLQAILGVCNSGCDVYLGGSGENPNDPVLLSHDDPDVDVLNGLLARLKGVQHGSYEADFTTPIPLDPNTLVEWYEALIDIDDARLKPTVASMRVLAATNGGVLR